MKAALAGIAAAILIAIIGAVALRAVDTSSSREFAIQSSVRL